MKKLILSFTLIGSFALAACNTVEGAGKDLKSAGDAVEDTAHDAK